MNIFNKKRLILSYIISLIFCISLFSSCFRNTPANSIKSMGEDEDGREVFNIEIGDRKHEGLFLLASCKSSSASKPMSLNVYGKSYSPYNENNSDGYIPILAITKEDKLLLFEWERCDVYPPWIYMGDIDGDGQDEIIFRSTIFYGNFPAHVLKIVGNELVELYRFPQYTDNPNVPITEIRDSIPKERANFGFTSRLLDGYKILIEFPALQFSKTIDLSASAFDHIRLDSFYDENGKPLNDSLYDLSFNYFHKIDLSDVDGDGICEVIGKQNIGLKYKQSIGNVKVTLKYSSQSKTMEVIAVDLEEIK